MFRIVTGGEKESSRLQFGPCWSGRVWEPPGKVQHFPFHRCKEGSPPGKQVLLYNRQAGLGQAHTFPWRLWPRGEPGTCFHPGTDSGRAGLKVWSCCRSKSPKIKTDSMLISDLCRRYLCWRGLNFQKQRFLRFWCSTDIWLFWESLLFPNWGVCSFRNNRYDSLTSSELLPVNSSCRVGWREWSFTWWPPGETLLPPRLWTVECVWRCD